EADLAHVARLVVRHRRKRRAAAIGPAEKRDMGPIDIATLLEVAQSAISVQRAVSDLVDYGWTVLVGPGLESPRIANRPEIVDHQRDIAALREQPSPRLVPRRQGCRSIFALGTARIGTGTAVHHHHRGRLRGRIGGLEHIAFYLG